LPLAPTHLMAHLPATIPFNGRDVPLWTLSQLELASKLTLKQRALNLRDQVGSDQLPPLAASGPAEAIVKWLLEVQVALCRSKGLLVELADFGWKAPLAAEAYFNPPTPEPRAPPPPQAAAADLSAQAAYADAMLVAQTARQRNQSSLAFGDGAAAVRSRPPSGAPPTHNDVFNDAAEGARKARARNQGSNIFG